MPDQLAIPLLLALAVVGWLVAAALLLERNKWRQSYRGALRVYGDLLAETSKPVEPTPHEKAVETKRRQRSEWVKQHIAQIESTIGQEADKRADALVIEPKGGLTRIGEDGW